MRRIVTEDCLLSDSIGFRRACDEMLRRAANLRSAEGAVRFGTTVPNVDVGQIAESTVIRAG